MAAARHAPPPFLCPRPHGRAHHPAPSACFFSSLAGAAFALEELILLNPYHHIYHTLYAEVSHRVPRASPRVLLCASRRHLTTASRGPLSFPSLGAVLARRVHHGAKVLCPRPRMQQQQPASPLRHYPCACLTPAPPACRGMFGSGHVSSLCHCCSCRPPCSNAVHQHGQGQVEDQRGRCVLLAEQKQGIACATSRHAPSQHGTSRLSPRQPSSMAALPPRISKRAPFSRLTKRWLMRQRTSAPWRCRLLASLTRPPKRLFSWSCQAF